MLEFAFAVLLLELTPGPNMAYLASLALARGRVAGLFACIGVALGLAVHAILAAIGAGALIQQSPLVYETLRWLGVAYLFYLAWEGWRPEKENSPSRIDFPRVAGPLLLRGFLSNAFNPKSILFFVSVVPTFIESTPDDPAIPVQMAKFGAVYVAIATAVHASIVALASQLQPWLANNARHTWIRRILSVALALVAIWLIWSTRR